ncbi:MAG: hypothetical protein ACI4J7_05625 [Ruminiclostridium sp.]
MESKATITAPCMIDLQTAKIQTGLSYYTLRSLALSGRVPAMRVGGKKGKIMVNSQKLMEFLAAETLKE